MEQPVATLTKRLKRLKNADKNYCAGTAKKKHAPPHGTIAACATTEASCIVETEITRSQWARYACYEANDAIATLMDGRTVEGWHNDDPQNYAFCWVEEDGTFHATDKVLAMVTQKRKRNG